MLIDVNLGHNKEVTLTYELYDNAVTRLFYDRISSQPNEVVSRNEFYNFGESQQDITQELNDIIDDLRHLVPDLIGDDNVENLNQLHINFPDNEKKYANNPKVFALLRDFNNRIHHLERLPSELFCPMALGLWPDKQASHFPVSNLRSMTSNLIRACIG